MKAITIVITDAESRVAHYCAAALRRGRHEVVLIGVSSLRIPKLGVYNQTIHSITSQESAESWANFLNDLFKADSFLMPISMNSWQLTLQAKDEIEMRVFTSPGLAAFEMLSDKWSLFELCTARWPGIMPESFLCHSIFDIYYAAERLGLPMVLKVRREGKLKPNDRYRIVRNISDVEASYNCLGSHEVIAQRFISGESIGVGVWSSQERGVELFGHRRIRSELSTGGPSTYCERLLVPNAEEMCRLIVSSLAYTGLGMFEFIRDISGRVYLLEINPRPWGSIQLPIACGVNFPVMWFCDSKGDCEIQAIHVEEKIRKLKYVRLDFRAWMSQNKFDAREFFRYLREYFDPSCMLHFTQHDVYRLFSKIFGIK